MRRIRTQHRVHRLEYEELINNGNIEVDKHIKHDVLMRLAHHFIDKGYVEVEKIKGANEVEFNAETFITTKYEHELIIAMLNDLYLISSYGAQVLIDKIKSVLDE